MSAFLAPTRDFGLDASSSAPSSLSSNDGVVHLTKKRTRPKLEIERLHAKHTELQRQLQLLQLLRPPQRALTPWRARAMRLAEAAQRARQENTRLRSLVDDQRRLLEALKRTVTKRPRLASIESDGQLHVAAKWGLLLQEQYGKMESEWIRRRLYDAVEPLRHTTLERSTKDGAMTRFGFLAKMHAPLDYKSMADLVWTHKPLFLGPSCSVYHTIHTDMVCTRELTHFSDLDIPVLETHDCFGRFLKPDRVVIVWRSLREDEAMVAPNPSHLVGHRCGWLLIEKTTAFECRVQCSMSTTVPTLPASASATEVAAWTDRLLKLSQTSKDAFGAMIHTSVLERREQLGLSNHAVDMLDVTDQVELLSICAFA
ncbi:hypothetical protein SDRG_14003 [Saprolegnia diclina VS20]|uniref:START domain-containing protein n=1 Tax=Saprolegnia diclina (strain VS20) TaxID=1156394 RepID=T0R7W0_SAPDV|nr:hypothetical protein SDRG_14003 [Saprolegnia diclina VS20]EQC28178.1 hypothetical protein SDRG_14003 [Saprolegnia diclina VS20]|eukprot:XP_008618327.1 hypothetical protein SDRG_14003 [Saprolegnia diclina VS20]